MHNTWVATSYGALDLTSHATAADAGIDCMVLPTWPSEPIGLKDAVAALWRRLVAGPVADIDLSAGERRQVREFAEFGLASSDLDDPARTTVLPAPWLNSPLHEMVYSLVAHLAREAGVRVVFIKGPALHRQGLRDRENSGDVDAWADPDRIEVLRDQLIEWGWQVWPSSPSGFSPRHSITLRPDSWGCEIDLHYTFPGVAASDQEAFAVMSESGEPLAFAGTTVMVPHPDAHAVISALHSFRPSVGHPAASPREAAGTLQRAGAGTIGVAFRLQADAALAPVLAEAFPEQFAGPVHDLPVDWRWRAQPTLVRFHLMTLRLLPARERPRMLVRLLWPPSELAFVSDASAGGHSRTAVEARVRRLGRGVRAALPRRKSR